MHCCQTKEVLRNCRRHKCSSGILILCKVYWSILVRLDLSSSKPLFLLPRSFFISSPRVPQTIYAESRGNVIVGASRKLLNLLTYKQEKSAIEELYCHHRSLRSSTVTILDDEVYLGNDFGCDIFTVGKNSEEGCFEIVGKYHLGERVSRFRGGSLMMGMFDQILTYIFGTDSGWIGIVASVPQNQYSFLFKLQSVLRKVIKYKGGLSHQKWISNISAEEEEVEDASLRRQSN
ncbi:hypothetical protein POM88_033190 [Heracleum sosnowskyi]|uniref:RSE1/DDB1/CPSF1 C-terminal domain-containing protein n=1 Tax=Heracleum sosnowskyi TaxID=360622 RepID=A0AAD8MLC3_9APIA|nr:hypothetical protein POM88_033190 [Heracleum sosnowskyi]